ncbi:MAG: hypothetical protein ABIJ57_12080 [Pseudomonadota bacterium]
MKTKQCKTYGCAGQATGQKTLCDECRVANKRKAARKWARENKTYLQGRLGRPRARVSREEYTHDPQMDAGIYSAF